MSQLVIRPEASLKFSLPFAKICHNGRKTKKRHCIVHILTIMILHLHEFSEKVPFKFDSFID